AGKPAIKAGTSFCSTTVTTALSCFARRTNRPHNLSPRNGTLARFADFPMRSPTEETRMATVLLVEGDDQVRVLAESYLEEQGHEVLSAGTAPGALALLDKTSRVDLLITDVDLKEEIAAGIELAQQAVKTSPNLKVLYTTDRSLTDGMKARFAKNSALSAEALYRRAIADHTLCAFPHHSAATPP